MAFREPASSAAMTSVAIFWSDGLAFNASMTSEATDPNRSTRESTIWLQSTCRAPTTPPKTPAPNRAHQALMLRREPAGYPDCPSVLAHGGRIDCGCSTSTVPLGSSAAAGRPGSGTHVEPSDVALLRESRPQQASSVCRDFDTWAIVSVLTKRQGTALGQHLQLLIGARPPARRRDGACRDVRTGDKQVDGAQQALHLGNRGAGEQFVWVAAKDHQVLSRGPNRFRKLGACSGLLEGFAAR